MTTYLLRQALVALHSALIESFEGGPETEQGCEILCMPLSIVILVFDRREHASNLVGQVDNIENKFPNLNLSG